MTDSNIRLSRPTDIGNLVALDLKSYPYPLPMEAWRKLVECSGREKEPRVVVIDVDKKAIGFATWVMKEDSFQIVRLGVRETFGDTEVNYRRRGYGSKLVGQCVMEASRHGKRKIAVNIPDIQCIPDDPDNIVEFLTKNGFEATGEVVTKFGRYYGELADAYVFERPI